MINSHPNSRSNSQFGFTFIELLVVIAIVGLLSSTTLAALSSVREKTVNTSLFSEIRSLHQWMLGYQASTGKYPGPDNVYSNYVLCRSTNNLNWVWPPAGTSNEAPFQQGVPHLYVAPDNSWYGCIDIGIDNDPENLLGYEMYFYTYFNGEADSEKQSKILSSIFGRPEDEAGCEVFDDYVNFCYVQYFH